MRFFFFGYGNFLVGYLKYLLFDIMEFVSFYNHRH